MNWDLVVREFVSLWVVIDPIGTIPVFIAATAVLDPPARRQVAFKATFVASCILLFFIGAGQYLLEAMEIHLEAFQMAGGIILFMFATTMIFGESKPEQETGELKGNLHHLAIFPLAVPSLASPGAMLAVVMLTDNHRHSLADQVATTAVMLSVMLITLLLLLLAGPIQRIIGMAGASVVSRVMGLVLASVAVDNVLGAIVSFFQLQVG